MRLLHAPAGRVSLQLKDFKDRRDRAQRRSFAAIGGLAQSLADRALIARFHRNVEANIDRRRRASAGKLPPLTYIERYAPPDEFIPDFLRAEEMS